MHSRPTYKLAWLYPNLMELYGDTGNITLLSRRCAVAGINLVVDSFTIGEAAELASYDFIFLGGGSDREQQIFYADLMDRKEAFVEAIEADVVTVTICGGYQLLGQYYKDTAGNMIEGMGIFDYHTAGEPPRTIGYLVEEAVIDGEKITLAGFENHSGLTYGVTTPLAKVISGVGNNKDDDTEGVSYRNLIGTYLHGPLLARNPKLTDVLINRMVTRRGDDIELPKRESDFSQQAQNQVLREAGLLK
ncbi:MAG: glutamine amidotransferase [Propionibacterium sp.]|nr:MAG: glutamine amidotransferase [Propionibacterium sp.]